MNMLGTFDQFREGSNGSTSFLRACGMNVQQNRSRRSFARRRIRFQSPTTRSREKGADASSCIGVKDRSIIQRCHSYTRGRGRSGRGSGCPRFDPRRRPVARWPVTFRTPTPAIPRVYSCHGDACGFSVRSVARISVPLGTSGRVSSFLVIS
jgi:hypothetical protein